MSPARLHGGAALVVATLLVALGTTPPAAAIDLSGDYVGFNAVPYQFSASGTVDPGTGAVSVTGAIETLCADFAFSGTGDGEELTGTAIAHCVNGTQGPGPF